MMGIKTLAGAVVLGLATFGIGCGDSGDSGSSADTIKIGYSGDFSGALAAYDTPLRDGLQFAADEINASDAPYEIDLVIKDNKGDPQLTVSQTQQFLDEGREINIVGAGEGRTAAASVVSQAGGLALGPLNTYPTFVDEAGDNSALLVVTDNIQAAASARYACDQGYKTVYTFESDDFAYLSGLPAYFEDAFAHYCDGTVVGTSQFSLGQTDWSAQITALKSTNPPPDAIYNPAFVPDSTAFAKQLSQAGVDLPYFSTDAAYLEDFVESAGSAANGIIATPYAFAAPDSPLAKFQAEFKAATGSSPATPLYEAIGRDQIYALEEGAKLASSTDPVAILDEFGNLPDDTLIALNGATIDPDTGLPDTATIPIVQIENGTFTKLAEITPDYVPEPQR